MSDSSKTPNMFSDSENDHISENEDLDQERSNDQERSKDQGLPPSSESINKSTPFREKYTKRVIDPKKKISLAEYRRDIPRIDVSGYKREYYNYQEDETDKPVESLKEPLYIILAGTKPCNNVVPKDGSSVYGICTRVSCSFAHSLEELRDPMCGYDTEGRTIYGKRTMNGINKNKMCMFRHTNETRDEWINRTSRKVPNLPETSADSRKPEEKSDLSEKSDLAEKKEHSSVGKNLEPSKQYTVIVPTKELVEVALRVAFERGIYSIKIMIE